MSDLRSLLSRLEGAVGPDRELDAAIEVAVRWIEAALEGLAPEHRAPWRPGPDGGVEDPFTRYMSAPFTASLDAALGLVERVLPGWRKSVVVLTPAPCEAYLWHPESGTIGKDNQSKASTPALALLIALLRSLSEGEGRAA